MPHLFIVPIENIGVVPGERIRPLIPTQIQMVGAAEIKTPSRQFVLRFHANLRSKNDDAIRRDAIENLREHDVIVALVGLVLDSPSIALNRDGA